MPRRPLLLVGLALLVGLLAACPVRRGVGPAPAGGVEQPTRSARLGLAEGELQRLSARVRAARDALDASDAASDPAVRTRLQAALVLVDGLRELEAGDAPAEQREGEAIKLYARYLLRVTGAEPAAPNPVEGPPSPSSGGLAAAIAAHSAGELNLALEAGLSVLDELQEHGVDAPALAFRIAGWAMEAGRPALAARLYREAALAAEASADLAERAELEAALAAAAQRGPDAVELARIQAQLDGGDWVGADAALAALAEKGSDAQVLGEAAALRDRIRRDAARLAGERLQRADVLLAGPGPYGEVGPLLDSVEALPGGTYDDAELLRLRAWHRSLTRGAQDEESARTRAEQEAALEEARALVAAERYRESLALFDRLEGTPLQSAARAERRRAVDTLVQQERERAGRLFLAARKQSGAARTAALIEVRDLLAGLLADFPESSYAERVRVNLGSVEAELGGG